MLCVNILWITSHSAAWFISFIIHKYIKFETLSILGCYAANVGSLLPTFCDNSWLQTFAVFCMSCVTFWVVLQRMVFNSWCFASTRLWRWNRHSVPKHRSEKNPKGYTRHFVLTDRSDLKQSKQSSFALWQKFEMHNLRIFLFFNVIHPTVCCIIRKEMCFVFDGRFYIFLSFKVISFGLVLLLLFTHTWWITVHTHYFCYQLILCSITDNWMWWGFLQLLQNIGTCVLTV
jgi:hypothetical protein